ncbi:MAG: 2-amino-4-hydroxy-6-hydroxymethyldihydropteridine diphosphokinase [Pseudohongiellaceae bacterium]|jgi:2-amino-4-hydroxy-6-hydroxymethyldihydropteridine diphosphokinase
MTVCYIGLGSNLQNPQQQVTEAVQEIAQIPQTTLLNQSHWYQSTAVGPGTQDDYVNGAVKIETQLRALELLYTLQAIEQRHRRIRIEHWGPRTLDLDLLAYGDELIDHPRLSVPHPRIAERNFVIYPLYDLAPNLKLANQLSLAALYKQIGDDGLQRINQ